MVEQQRQGICCVSVLGFERPFDSFFEYLIALFGSIRDVEEKGEGWERSIYHLISQVGDGEVLFSVHRWESDTAPLYPVGHSSPFPWSSALSVLSMVSGDPSGLNKQQRSRLLRNNSHYISHTIWHQHRSQTMQKPLPACTIQLLFLWSEGRYLI